MSGAASSSLHLSLSLALFSRSRRCALCSLHTRSEPLVPSSSTTGRHRRVLSLVLFLALRPRPSQPQPVGPCTEETDPGHSQVSLPALFLLPTRFSGQFPRWRGWRWAAAEHIGNAIAHHSTASTSQGLLPALSLAFVRLCSTSQARSGDSLASPLSGAVRKGTLWWTPFEIESVLSVPVSLYTMPPVSSTLMAAWRPFSGNTPAAPRSTKTQFHFPRASNQYSCLIYLDLGFSLFSN